jgi:hypothetical protein
MVSRTWGCALVIISTVWVLPGESFDFHQPCPKSGGGTDDDDDDDGDEMR